MKYLLLALIIMTSSLQADDTAYRTVGTYAFSRFGIPVYQATLSAPEGQHDPSQPFELSLTYKLGLKGHKIAEQAIKEMRHQSISAHRLKQWQTQLEAIIPNVQRGDTLTGRREKNGGFTLLKNREKVGNVDDPELSRAFFNIWLGTSSTNQKQRRSLLGISD